MRLTENHGVANIKLVLILKSACQNYSKFVQIEIFMGI